MESRRRYRAIYDHVLSRIYDLYMGWYMLPYGGEPRFRRGMAALRQAEIDRSIGRHKKEARKALSVIWRTGLFIWPRITNRPPLAQRQTSGLRNSRN